MKWMESRVKRSLVILACLLLWQVLLVTRSNAINKLNFAGEFRCFNKGRSEEKGADEGNS